MNKLPILGNLTKDPELRYTQSQKPVASFTVAVDRDYKPENGERETDFIDCVAWRGKAEFISKYFHKGSSIVLNGRIQTRRWSDDAGNTRKATEIHVENAYFGEPKKKDEGGAPAPAADLAEPRDPFDLANRFPNVTVEDGEIF